MIDDLDDDPNEGAVDFEPEGRKRFRYSDWRDGLPIKKSGRAQPRLANAMAALRLCPELKGMIRLNEFTRTGMLSKRPPWDGRTGQWAERPVTNADDVHFAEWLQNHDIMVGPGSAADSLQAVADENRYHPIRDYLRSVRDGGAARIDTWTVDFLGTKDTPYTVAVGRNWLVQSVYRVMSPGCKADHTPTIEGGQGVLKTSTLHTLYEPWCGELLGDLGTQAAAEQLNGMWCVELAELAGMSRSSVERIKSFISRTTDRYRPKYGRRAENHDRQCVFVGTTNSEFYLRDETGNRRFWPLRCGDINIQGLVEARDSLWAQAVAAYDQREPYWLNSMELADAARAEQAKRLEQDPWYEAIEKHLHQVMSKKESEPSTSVREIMEVVLGIEVQHFQQRDQNRVAKCLKILGWEKYQDWNSGNRRWRYRAGPGWCSGEDTDDED